MYIKINRGKGVKLLGNLKAGDMFRWLGSNVPNNEVCMVVDPDHKIPDRVHIVSFQSHKIYTEHKTVHVIPVVQCEPLNVEDV